MKSPSTSTADLQTAIDQARDAIAALADRVMDELSESADLDADRSRLRELESILRGHRRFSGSRIERERLIGETTDATINAIRAAAARASIRLSARSHNAENVRIRAEHEAKEAAETRANADLEVERLEQQTARAKALRQELASLAS